MTVLRPIKSVGLRVNAVRQPGARKPVAIGHSVKVLPSDKFRSPYSGGAAITPGPIFIPLVRAAGSKPGSCVRHLPLGQEGEAICIGLSEALGLGAPPHQAPRSPALAPGTANGRKGA